MAGTNNVKAERTCGFWYGHGGPDGIIGQPAAEGEKVTYHLHGKWRVRGLLEHFDQTCVSSLSNIDCPPPPIRVRQPFPTALINAIAGYKYLVEDLKFAPQNIVIGGDLAGTSIAFSLALYIAVNKLLALPSAGGLLLISPTVDWAVTHTGPDSAMERNHRSDFVQTIMTSGNSKRALLGSLPEEMAATSTWIFPGSLKVQRPPTAEDMHRGERGPGYARSDAPTQELYAGGYGRGPGGLLTLRSKM
ncbi:hypothetical protein OBBRIDRAFT_867961 [Obba rivulosa]|uniref:Alpha/beta hydrolase fold-3 domain-containing protein n=1 Tax=Obba rivulosa TaxID=1052685 RepID=A0A8E2DDT2_9APHY|nr:hypothetical protein OBBRIDRAFT_867961 [Obba rivulosa]